MAPPRETATLIQWDDAKGCGFLRGDSEPSRLFVRLRDFELLTERPRQGERFSFEPGVDGQGRRRALRVRRPRAPEVVRPRASAGTAGLLLIPGFAAAYLACHLLWGLPPALWGGYMALSLASFIVYAGDKRAARLGQWRVKESTLHGLALAGGWPGALLAQSVLRHKSSKAVFRRRFWFTVWGNCFAFALIFTPLRSSLWAALGLAAN